MTADERIEKLLNRFGQTIEDLPKPTEEGYAYEEEHRRAAREAALNWSDVNYTASPFLKDYICHLCDVIDRMEIALETAANNSGCDFCEKQWNDCKLQPNNEQFVCDYRISDEWLY